MTQRIRAKSEWTAFSRRSKVQSLKARTLTAWHIVEWFFFSFSFHSSIIGGNARQSTVLFAAISTSEPVHNKPIYINMHGCRPRRVSKSQSMHCSYLARILCVHAACSVSERRKKSVVLLCAVLVSLTIRFDSSHALVAIFLRARPTFRVWQFGVSSKSYYESERARGFKIVSYTCKWGIICLRAINSSES